MSCMFSYCSSLTSLNLSNFNTHNVNNMSIKVFILLKLIKIKNFVREILVNFILTSLKEYILDDISYLNIDNNTLYSFLLLLFL